MKFWFRPFDFWFLPVSLSKIAKIGQKVIIFFLEREEEMGPWFLNIWIVLWLKFFCKCKCIYFFSISAIFREKRGVKVGPKVQTLGTFRLHKNLRFSKILKLKITFSLVECYLWWKFYQSRTMFTEFRAEIAPPERAMLMLNQYEKNWKFITWQPQTLYLWNVLRLCIFIRPSIWQIIEAWFITCNRA